MVLKAEGLQHWAVHELLTKIHVILDSTVSKQVSSTAHILAHLFNSSSRLHCEVWASYFLFLHNIKDPVPPSEACLDGSIIWSLAHTTKNPHLD